MANGGGGGATDAAGRCSPMVVTQTMERVGNTDVSSDRKRRRQVNSGSTNVSEKEKKKKKKEKKEKEKTIFFDIFLTFD